MGDKYLNSAFLYMNKWQNGCPILSEDKIIATEQLLNAIILNNCDNVTARLHKVLMAERLYLEQSAKYESLVELISSICQELNSDGYIIDYASATVQNGIIEFRKNFKSRDRKPKYINDEFETECHVEFKGIKLEINHSYYEFIQKKMNELGIKGLLSSNDDKLIEDKLLPIYEDHLVEVRGTINENVENYLNQFYTQHMSVNLIMNKIKYVVYMI